MVKMVVIARADLKLRKGALSVQASHVSTLWFADRVREVIGRQDWQEAAQGVMVNLTNTTSSVVIRALVISAEENEWLARPSTIVMLRAETQEQFYRIHQQLLDAGLGPQVHVWYEEDLGDNTCFAVGPIDSDRIDPFTSHLKLFQ